MATYPMLRLISRHGDRLAIACALVPLLAAVLALILGYSPWWLVAGVLGGAVVWGLAKSYAELVGVMTDMMLPK